jgi:hypothetical protein
MRRAFPVKPHALRSASAIDLRSNLITLPPHPLFFSLYNTLLCVVCGSLSVSVCICLSPLGDVKILQGHVNLSLLWGRMFGNTLLHSSAGLVRVVSICSTNMQEGGTVRTWPQGVNPVPYCWGRAIAVVVQTLWCVWYMHNRGWSGSTPPPPAAVVVRGSGRTNPFSLSSKVMKNSFRSIGQSMG